ncbi:MAG: hypothetical protein HZA14_04515 [Nitrospirae bacterium]|nr:hypothetical protein [Nitrospirota bacterium]
MNWYVLYTKPGCEDSAARLINNIGIETFSPKIKTTRYRRGGFNDIIEPLFPSYIFAFFDAERQSRALKYTRGVRYIIGKENPSRVFPEIIDAIKERMNGDIVTPVRDNFSNGDNVLITCGPFKDFHGIFERYIPGKERAMVLLEALQCRLNICDGSIKKA